MTGGVPFLCTTYPGSRKQKIVSKRLRKQSYMPAFRKQETHRFEVKLHAKCIVVWVHISKIWNCRSGMWYSGSNSFGIPFVWRSHSQMPFSKLDATRIGEQCYSRPTQACDKCDFLICAWFTRINDGDAFWYHICENTVDCVRLWETGINELNGALHINYTAVICLTLQKKCPLGPATLGLQHILGLGMSAVGTLKWHFLTSALQ